LRLVAQPEDGGILELAVVPTFASRWLIPRLARFQKLHPNIILNISERTKPFPISGSGFDAVVHFNHPAWVGHQVHPLFAENLIPVCRPGLIDEHTKGVSSLVLLHKRNTPNVWRDYAKVNELPVVNTIAGPRFDLFSMLIDAALAGLGVALVPRVYVEAELKTGSLHIPWAPYEIGNTFVVVTLNDVTLEPNREAFIQWLMVEAQLFSASDTSH
jgi:DNA-binding transcriptional LysR family regulator